MFSLIFRISFMTYRYFLYFCYWIWYNHFQTLRNIRSARIQLASAKPEKLKHKINKNWHGSSHVIAWVALSDLLIKVFSGPAL